MPANIAVIDGQEAFVSARVVPWHKLGTVVPEAMTAKEALHISNLDYTVETTPLYVRDADSGLLVPVDGRRATVRRGRDGEPVPLGIVGNRYQIIQNEDAFAVLDAIVDQSGAHFETAGALGNGGRVFMSMKLPEGVMVAGEDAHDVYLLAYNSHDGSGSFQVAVTPVRVVCQNTLTMALRSAKQKFSIRHTESAQGRIQEAREALSVTFEYLDSFQEELDRLLDQEMTDDEFWDITQELLPINPDAKLGWKQRVMREQRALANLLLAETNEFGRGTAYAAYNAIVEYADWYMPVKGGDIEGTKRAERAMNRPTVQNFKDKGLALLTR